ncbi:nitrate/nitrite transporter [Candidatus Nitronereus thalassa]|uniref:MFS transporter n=1 Tax=Candidatus Nitronereus thalassa TaxID=3020898 RepID=A0ABU3K4K7_9BACT|nr:MFS transporter [Candidatus Nitronereus thalassa]MDT7041304.1 MFS transporter [Candidatus Nitronereus thalassa]
MRLKALKDGHWPSLLGAWLHFEVSFMVWLLIGALGVAIAQEFDLSATQKGFLVGVPLLGGALLRIVVGPFADLFGAKQVGLGILALEVVALLLGWLFGASYFHMLGVGFLLGFAGASFAIALPIASLAYPPERQGLAMGVAAIGNSGVLLATFFGPRIAESIGWQNTFGVMIIPVVMTAILFYLLVPDHSGQVFRKSGATFSVRSALQQPFMYWLCFLYGVTFGGFVGFSSFLPIYFHDQYQLDMVTAGTITAICGLAGSLARPVGGHLADRLGGIGLLLTCFLVTAILSVLLSGLLPLKFALPLTIIMLLFLGFGNGVVFQIVSLRFQGIMGTASGFVGAAGGIGGFLLPSWFGVLKDATGSYASGFLVFGLCSGLAATSVLYMQRWGRVSLNAPSVPK